jgi:glutamate dehydrogenase (NADP+)
MLTILQICLDAGNKHTGEDLSSGNVLPSLLSGANVAGFIKVADAMKQQGDWW